MPIPAKKILIVEDHLFFRAMLVRLVRDEPDMIVCGQTDNVADALNLIDQTHPDVALVDLTLSGSNGLDLISELNAKNVELPVLVLSMHPKNLCADRVIRAGAKAYVSKQELPEAVVAAIRSIFLEAVPA